MRNRRHDGTRVWRSGLLVVVLFLPSGALPRVPARWRGAVRMRYRITEPLEEVANRIACGGMPADKKRSYRQNQNDSLKQTTHECCHSAPRSAVFNISGAFLVGRPRSEGLAATLKGALVGLLTGFSLAPDNRWWTGIGTGALYGFAFALVVYLAKGGPQSGDAPFVIPSGILFGGLTGLFIIIWAFKKV